MRINYLSALLFIILTYFLGMLIPISYSLAFLKNDSKIADKGAKNWSRMVMWLLKFLCKIDYKIIGAENIPDFPCIIACKHQSMWETVVMHLIFNRPVYCYKKELEKVPFYGWYLKKMSAISIDRNGGASAVKNLINSSKKYINNNQNIIIFPQGTRVPIDATVEKYPYQSGIVAMYKQGFKIVPVALNSGLFWPRKGLKFNSGTIIIEFLPAIEDGFDKNSFIDALESRIENSSNNLLKKY